ncbi:MAG: anaerobic ribonucleoside-triphosphate reductase activating protein [Anaerolineales bacterium]|nr:anaerobic ribonucleoside-triphosphate reductase activating protein [Anaerolineales bacterium]
MASGFGSFDVNLNLKGWVRTSLIDFPDHIATVLFTGGCNFRCPMCYNADLVLKPSQMPALTESEVWAFLERRRGLVTGVVITGGEPTLQRDLAAFLTQLRERRLDIKLDTNGYAPDVLANLLDGGLLDYVALDIKAPPDKYPLLVGMNSVDVTRVERSIALLQESGIPHEFRTTVVPGMLDDDDIEAIARWVASAERYVLQQFRALHTLDPALESISPYPTARLQAMAERASHWLPCVRMRGG